MHESRHDVANGAQAWRGGRAEWVALGAVIAGSVGALVAGANAHRRRTSRRRDAAERPDSASITPPHGDKLPLE